MTSKLCGHVSISSKLITAIFLILSALILPSQSQAQANDECQMCHEDESLTKEQDGKEISVYIDFEKFGKSVHGELDCIYCHTDLDGFEDFPHPENLEKVDCSLCHDKITELYDNSLHGKAVKAGVKLAPRCQDCHGNIHTLVPVKDPNSPVLKFNIPFVCGSCHKEGTPVTRTYDIPQDSILTHYSESIHGVGLFKQGLTVTAVCNDCHTSHNVLPHTDPKSSIYRDNVANTCQKCHGRIEEVHRKVIRGELWEKEPHKVPVCVDCHAPHEIRRVLYEEGMSDKECLKCHSKPDLTAVRDGEVVSMYVDTLKTHGSIHRQIGCAQCHTGATPSHGRPCATVIPKVDCSICHSEVAENYVTSIHGKLTNRGELRTPQCTTCHGTHNIKDPRDPASPTYPTHVPDLCGECHGPNGVAAEMIGDTLRDPVTSYLNGIHGIGLKQSGLVVTAKCTDCHTTHHILPPENPESSVNPVNLSKTCSECHQGIYEEFEHSIHSPTFYKTDKKQPTCNDCHASHAIVRTDSYGFRNEIMLQCGKCHEDVTESYFETFHGKVSKLGYAAAAKCYDCHGSHNILPPSNPKSTLSRENIVKTCGKCHPGSHRQFAGYLTHATHHDKHKYPILFYTFWFMTILLVSTLIIAGTHTLMWLPRSFQLMKEHKQLREKYHGQLEFRRFKSLHSRLHIMVVMSFLGLAVTGMTLKFSYLPWAQWISQLLGGFDSTGLIHRIFALVTFGYFFAHIIDLIISKHRSRKSWWKFFTDRENTMLPTRQDWQEFTGTLKWFVGAGPRPRYGRWTYWEKFDYFAVFWGVAVIGSTGLMLWFPEFFTRFLPGWIINVATIIHSDEALLATAFIFTVHFFNTHFRPDKFPMDTVIFTGRVPVEELKLDRPREYDDLMKTRKLKKHLVEPLPPVLIKVARIFGTAALITGLILIFLIVWAEIFGYR